MWASQHNCFDFLINSLSLGVVRWEVNTKFQVFSYPWKHRLSQVWLSAASVKSVVTTLSYDDSGKEKNVPHSSWIWNSFYFTHGVTLWPQGLLIKHLLALGGGSEGLGSGEACCGSWSQQRKEEPRPEMVWVWLASPRDGDSLSAFITRFHVGCHQDERLHPPKWQNIN